MPRFLLHLIICPIVLIGCTKYQYSTISSDLPENKLNEFVIENDTIAITYSFNGLNCPVNIRIQNKLDVPLFIDWRRSALIHKDQTISYANNNSSVHLVSSGSQINWTPSVSTSSAEIVGEITRSESLSFIPPLSAKKSQLLAVKYDFFNLPGPKKKYRTKIITGIDSINVLRYTFNRLESPLEFRSYLTVSTDAQLMNVVNFDNEFWVSEVIQTMSTDETTLKRKGGNQFYVKKMTGFGTVLALVGLGILGLLSL
jgi:hypothetical protein